MHNEMNGHGELKMHMVGRPVGYTGSTQNAGPRSKADRIER